MPGRPSGLPAPVDAPAQEAWLMVRLERCSPSVRAHAESLLSWAQGDSDHERLKRASVVTHLHGMIDEIWHYRDVAETATRARTRDLFVAEETGGRAEDGRKALLSGLDRVENLIDWIELEHPGVRTDWIERLRAATTAVHEAHRNAWERK